MKRKRARLVILDEPFRGLDRHTRHKLLLRARSHWQDSTLLFISHATRNLSDCIVFKELRQMVLSSKPTARMACLGFRVQLPGLHCRSSLQVQVWDCSVVGN